MKDEGRHHKRTSFLNHFLSILPEARNLRPSPRCVRSLWEKLKISLHSVDGLGQILRRRNLCFFGKLRHCNANLSITYTFFIRTSKFDLRLNVVILKPFWGSKCSKHVLIFYLYKIVYVYNNKGANVTNDLNLLENMNIWRHHTMMYSNVNLRTNVFKDSRKFQNNLHSKCFCTKCTKSWFFCQFHQFLL